tara:strand:- start:1355 stop:1924 length:570 start_codon:yes stop_codon:yes gene_type:complete
MMCEGTGDLRADVNMMSRKKKKEWQEKNKGESVSVFEQAWFLVKGIEDDPLVWREGGYASVTQDRDFRKWLRENRWPVDDDFAQIPFSEQLKVLSIYRNLQRNDPDSELNDDEFVDNDSFNSSVSDTLDSILSIVGMEQELDECYGCGLEGDLKTFMRRNASGRFERKCPSCGSFEVHGTNAYKGGGNE